VETISSEEEEVRSVAVDVLVKVVVVDGTLRAQSENAVLAADVARPSAFSQ